MAKLVSKTYGDALFSLAAEENRVNEFAEEVTAVQTVLEENRDFNKILVHPEIPKEQKLRLVENVFKGRVSDDLTGFLRIVVTKGRYKDLPAIFAYFSAKVKEYNKTGVAEVVSAVPLNGEQQKKIEQKLLDTTRYEKMEIAYKVDEDVIGGLRIRIGDRVVDSTIRSRLNKLTGSLMNISLETEQ